MQKMMKRCLSQNLKQIRFYANELKAGQHGRVTNMENAFDENLQQKAEKPGIDKNKDEARADRQEFGDWSQSAWKSDALKEESKDYNADKKLADLKRGKFSRDGQPINEAESIIEAEEYRDQ